MSAFLDAAQEIANLTRRLELVEAALRTAPVSAQPQRTHLRPSEVASKTGLRQKRVYELIHEGELEAVKDGQRYYVPVAAFQAFLSKRAVSA